MEEIRMFARVLKCKRGVLPFKYLGVPVGANMRKASSWEPIISKFQSKLSSWKAKMLSFGGRLVLIKSVMSNLPVYFFSLYRAPSKVIKYIDRIRMNFFGVGASKIKKYLGFHGKMLLLP